MNKAANRLLIISGIVNILFLVFHLMFYKLFNWHEKLDCLNNSDRGILLTFNLICILFLGVMAIFPFIFRKELLGTSLGMALLLVFTSFYSIRIFTEFYHFGYSGLESIIIITLCLIPFLCYLYGIYINYKTKNK